MKYLFLIFIFTFFFKGYTIVAEEILKDEEIFNIDSSKINVVYEHSYYSNGKNYHYISIFNILTNETEKILNNEGKIINDSMYFPSVSDDGKFLVFTSRATNITGDDLNLCTDISSFELKTCNNIYLYDIENKKSIMIKANGNFFNGDNYVAKISGDSSTIVYESISSNFINKKHDCSLINGISNCINIYKYNVLTGKSTLISTSMDNSGGNSNSISPTVSYDGRYIAFQSNSSNLVEEDFTSKYCYNYITGDNENCSYIYYADTIESSIKMISKKDNQIFNDNSGNPLISSDGSFVIYESYASNIEQNSNNKQHIILYQTDNSKNSIITKKNNLLNNRNNYLDDISQDGKYILFRTASTNLENENNILNLYVYEIESKMLSSITKAKNDIILSCFSGNYLFQYDDNKILNYVKIDSTPPIIKKDQVIYVLKQNTIKVKDSIEVADNLSIRNKIDLYIDNQLQLENIGEYVVNITAVDEFDNTDTQSIKVIVLEKDLEGPLFNEVNEIKILKGSSTLNLYNYVEAFDKVDGKVRIFVVDDGGLNLNISGEYKIKIMAEDLSKNITYKEIDVIVYENYNFTYFYEIILMLGLIVIIIFSIIKVK